MAKLSSARRYVALRRRTSLPAGIPARFGRSGLMRLAIASGSSRFSRPSNSTCRIRLLLLPGQGLAGAVRPGKNGQNRHVSGCRSIQLADHTVVAFTRSTSDEAHFKFTAVRMFHDIETLVPVPIENRDTSFQRFQTGTRACSDNCGAEPIGKELAVLHVSIISPWAVQRGPGRARH
jgi:hypothetical protein